MKYDLTDRLRFEADPVLVIRGTELTIRSDAEIVLALMEALREQGEAAGAKTAEELLLSEEDRARLASLHLKLDDYLAMIRAAVQLALGGDPDGEDAAPGE